MNRVNQQTVTTSFFQDSTFPWNLRVSFATDIAAGMVRSVSLHSDEAVFV